MRQTLLLRRLRGTIAMAAWWTLAAACFPLVYKVALAFTLFPAQDFGIGALLSGPSIGIGLIGAFAVLGGGVAAAVVSIARRNPRRSLAASAMAIEAQPK